jgi:hypothetical protein
VYEDEFLQGDWEFGVEEVQAVVGEAVELGLEDGLVGVVEEFGEGGRDWGGLGWVEGGSVDEFHYVLFGGFELLHEHCGLVVV